MFSGEGVSSVFWQGVARTEAIVAASFCWAFADALSVALSSGAVLAGPVVVVAPGDSGALGAYGPLCRGWAGGRESGADDREKEGC
jgi:hypothetical protein